MLWHPSVPFLCVDVNPTGFPRFSAFQSYSSYIFLNSSVLQDNNEIEKKKKKKKLNENPFSAFALPHGRYYLLFVSLVFTWSTTCCKQKILGPSASSWFCSRRDDSPTASIGFRTTRYNRCRPKYRVIFYRRCTVDTDSRLIFLCNDNSII